MPYFFYYLLKVIICSGLLFGYYHLFLRNKVYHAYNRFYLLSATLLSLAIPLLNVELLFTGSQSDSKPIQLLQVVNNGNEYLEEIFIYSSPATLSRNEWMLIGYALFSLFLLFTLIKVWLHIYKLIKTHQSQDLNDVVFIPSQERGTPFSFFQYIFWNSDIDLNSATGRQIFAHELAHVREKHSLDKLYLNCLLIVFWINPVFWLIKKELNLIHEFIADKKAIADNDARALAAMIVQSAYPKHAFMLTSHFFYSPIKRRLKMLTKYSNSKAGYLYRILSLPLILFLIAVISIKAKSGITELVNPAEKITVLIDAGHGGHDGGAFSSDKKLAEKDITLALINKIKAYNNLDNINLVFTRTTDIYQTPQEKVGISNKLNADLCISLHVASNALPVTTKSGLEVYVSEYATTNSLQSNLIASAIIQQFQLNYFLPVASNPMQRSAGVTLLNKVNCPSVIIEAGFMNNPKDIAYLQTDAGQTAFAKNILAAIAQYADNKDQIQAEMLKGIAQDTIPELGIYNGQKIKNIRFLEKTKLVEIELANGKRITKTISEATKEGILPPPPPPPPPVAPIPATSPELPVPPPPPPPPPPPTLPSAKITVAKLDSLKYDLSRVDASEHLHNKNLQLNNHRITLTEVKIAQEKQTIALQEQQVSIALEPLYILEGKEVRAIEIKNINAANIEKINVLKGEQAALKYGKQKTMNGAVEIELKKNKQQLQENSNELKKNKQNLRLQEIKVAGTDRPDEKKLYLGVGNIIRINNEPSDLVINIQNGSINKINGDWIVKVNPSVTTTVLTLFSKNKSIGRYEFKIARVPDNFKGSFITRLNLN